MTAIQITLMTEIEARAAVDRIKSSLEVIRADLADLYEREGWRALRYDSWRACIVAEFEMSERRAYQLLAAHAVDRALCTNVQTPLRESHARELARLPSDDDIRDVWEEVRAEHADDAPTAAAYREAVNRRLGVDDRPTIGDHMQEIAEQLDASGAAEEIAAARRVNAMRTTRLFWFRFVTEHPPGVFSEGVNGDELADVVATLGRIGHWVDQAKETAAKARRPRRVGA